MKEIFLWRTFQTLSPLQLLFLATYEIMHRTQTLLIFCLPIAQGTAESANTNLAQNIDSQNQYGPLITWVLESGFYALYLALVAIQNRRRRR